MKLNDRIKARTRNITLALATTPPVLFDSAADGVDDAMAEYTDRDLSLKAVAALHEWLETEDGDLDEGESMADRLLALFIGIADENQDGELSDDEMEILSGAMEAAWDYLSSKGVTDDDASALLNDSDNDAALRVSELLKSSIGDGDAAMDDMDSFAFSDPVLDATYKKRLVVRSGKKVRINKRVSGHVRLTGKQKMAIRKAQRRSHSASAMLRRAKSNRVRARSMKR